MVRVEGLGVLVAGWRKERVLVKSNWEAQECNRCVHARHQPKPVRNAHAGIDPKPQKPKP